MPKKDTYWYDKTILKLKRMLSHECVSVNDEHWSWAVNMIPCVGNNILINFVHVRKYIIWYILLTWKNIPWHNWIFFHITKALTWPSHVAFSSPKHHVERVHVWFLMGIYEKICKQILWMLKQIWLFWFEESSYHM